MGFKNAPPIFMRLVDRILTTKGLRQNVAAFVDDITTHAATWDGYLDAQKRTLQAL